MQLTSSRQAERASLHPMCNQHIADVPASRLLQLCQSLGAIGFHKVIVVIVGVVATIDVTIARLGNLSPGLCSVCRAVRVTRSLEGLSLAKLPKHLQSLQLQQLTLQATGTIMEHMQSLERVTDTNRTPRCAFSIYPYFFLSFFLSFFLPLSHSHAHRPISVTHYIGQKQKTSRGTHLSLQVSLGHHVVLPHALCTALAGLACKGQGRCQAVGAPSEVAGGGALCLCSRVPLQLQVDLRLFRDTARRGATAITNAAPASRHGLSTRCYPVQLLTSAQRRDGSRSARRGVESRVPSTCPTSGRHRT